MRIVNILGGLGNQMFQFALFQALKQRFPEESVLVDLHCFNGYNKHRGFELDRVFPVTFETASWREIAQLAYPYPHFTAWRIGSRLLPVRSTMLKERPDFTYEPSALTRTGSTYYDGYWQHEEYFRHIRADILKQFAFPDFDDERNRQLAAEVTSVNSCSLHIRRGDYLTDPLRQGTTGADFAIRAISEMQRLQSPTLWCVFSDDMEWCRQHLSQHLDIGHTRFIDWNTGHRSIQDMHLMSLCRHNIIANSSFSWWGAWLNYNPDKTVIGPAQWMNMPGLSSPIPQSWTSL